MKTIKLPYNSNSTLLNIMKQYSSMVRYSYNRFLEDKTEKDIRILSKNKKLGIEIPSFIG